MERYDSFPDTMKHVLRVQQLLIDFSMRLIERGRVHDQSKFQSPEKELFDKWTPILKTLTYGTPEYQESLNNLKEAVDHHYLVNSHHPEHYPNGVDGMDLLDIVEMLLDWKAAGERNLDGNIYKSIDINKVRFGISEQLVEILKNTAKNLGL